MANQSPMVCIPKKLTDEVDWTTPIRNLIAQSYGENPDNYAAECAALQRCRQDAVRGAGSDLTARDLLYKYFGQLELLELRFSEIKVTFPWHDAFTSKLTTQTSIAFEKASILFQIAATHSAIAASQSRSDPEGTKRAFYYFRTCAGMLTYINENFLHAPSTDLSRDVIKFLSIVILAQATEVFFEKCVDERKANALVAKIGAQTATMYTTLSEEVKEFMGKGIFDRNWVTLVQVKAKYFSSLSHYYRGLADNAASKHGEALVRFTLADNLAKEAVRNATPFSSSFVPSMSPTLPADAGPALLALVKTHSTLCTERKTEASRENDLIYNAILPSPESLPKIEGMQVAQPVPIHEVYGAPEVQKTIGPDVFARLVPLSVHESASVYSEEKAKLVRAEVENAEGAEGKVHSALDAMGIKEGIVRYRAMAEGAVGREDEVPVEVQRWKDEIALLEQREGVEGMLRELNRLKDSVKDGLQGIERDLEIESRDCEEMRVKWEHKWTQDPSAGHSKPMRQDLKSHLTALDAAGTSDGQVLALWNQVRPEIQLLQSPAVEQLFRERGGSTEEHLLDLDAGNEADDAAERAKIGGWVAEIEDRLGKLNKISRERNEVLKDLKEKVQSDDVSHILLLNRRNTGVEPTLFAAELEKFRPYQQRLAATVHAQEIALHDMSVLWKGLKEHAGRGQGARKWDERERNKKDTVRRFANAKDGYMEVRDGIAKGLQFYTELTQLTNKLRSETRSFVSSRKSEREGLVAKLEAEKRLSSAAPPPLAARPPPVPPPPAKPSLDQSFSSMSLHGSSTPKWHNPVSQPAQQLRYNGGSSPTSSQHQSYSGDGPRGLYGSSLPSPFSPPPPPPTHHYQTPPPLYQPTQQYQTQSPPPQRQQQPGYGQPVPPPSFLPPPPPRPSQTSFYTPQSASNDPYTSLGMFDPPGKTQPHQQGSYGQQQAQQQQQQRSYDHTLQQQHERSDWSTSTLPPTPAQPARQEAYPYQPQQHHQQPQHQQHMGSFPLPPPSQQQQHQQQQQPYQYSAPLPPPPQQQQGYQYRQGYGQ